MTDISDTLAPTSDQLDAVDLLGGPRTFTITKVVVKSGAEQPVDVHLAEFPRVWRPGKSMRRVLAFCWSSDSTTWAGRRVTLFCDTAVRFGGLEVGGTRISHLSHIDGPKKVPLLVTRGKSAVFIVKPLADEPAPDPLAALWRKVNTIPGDQAKAFLVSAVGHELDKATDVTPDEAADILANFDALLADFTGATS